MMIGNMATGFVSTEQAPSLASAGEVILLLLDVYDYYFMGYNVMKKMYTIYET
jgi:hypothetical protein